MFSSIICIPLSRAKIDWGKYFFLPILRLLSVLYEEDTNIVYRIYKLFLELTS